MNYLLGVDLGTSGTKTVLFDEDGNVVASKTIEYPLYQEKNGWAEQSINTAPCSFAILYSRSFGVQSGYISSSSWVVTNVIFSGR